MNPIENHEPTVADGVFQRMEREGYAVMPVLGSEGIARLTEMFHHWMEMDRMPVRFDTLTFTPLGVRNALADGIAEVLRPVLQDHFAGMKVVAAMYYVKKSDPRTELGLHLDPSMTIEPHRHIGIWIPLIDADTEGGEFCILPRSRGFTHPYHALSIPSPYSLVMDNVRSYMNCLSVKAGHAVVFHNNMLHCSGPNNSGRTRLAVVVKLIDASAPVVCAFGRQEGSDTVIELIRVPDDYYHSPGFRKSERPVGEVIRELRNVHHLLTAKELEALVASVRD